MSASGDFSIGSTVWPGTSKLLEEMGELTQVFGKLIAIAGETRHWDGTELRERLVEEVGDVQAAIGFWKSKNLTPPERVQVGLRCESKQRLFEQWHSAQGKGYG